MSATKTKPAVDIGKVDQTFHYGVIDYDYDMSHDCEANGCDSICRCGRIQNARVTQVRPYGVISSVVSSSCKPILKYCVGRVITHMVNDPVVWELRIGGGYYGQEVYGADLRYDTANELKEILQELVKVRTAKGQIEFALNVEYGYVLDSIKKATGFEVQDVEIRNMSLVRSEEHYRRLDKKAVEYYKGVMEHRRFKEPIALCLRGDFGLRLIDGYHRMRGAEEAKKNKVKIIVGKA